jgi:hypothetical protein
MPDKRKEPPSISTRGIIQPHIKGGSPGRSHFESDRSPINLPGES